jgi:hypothetical protein
MLARFRYEKLMLLFSCFDPYPSYTSFDSKQPKLVSILSKIRFLFRLFSFCIKTVSFGVSIEPKQKKAIETNRKNKQ